MTSSIARWVIQGCRGPVQSRRCGRVLWSESVVARTERMFSIQSGDHKEERNDSNTTEPSNHSNRTTNNGTTSTQDRVERERFRELFENERLARQGSDFFVPMGAMMRINKLKQWKWFDGPMYDPFVRSLILASKCLKRWLLCSG
jgi:hypothetical protein